MQDLIRGIKKIVKFDEPKTTVVKGAVVESTVVNIAPLLERAFIFLEDGEFDRADKYFEQVLNNDPKNTEAYLGKLMAEFKVKTREVFKNCKNPFDNSNNYKRLLKFADDELKSYLLDCLRYINDRNVRLAFESVQARIESFYVRAKNKMDSAETESESIEAANAFNSIKSYKDSAMLSERCRANAEHFKELAKKEKRKTKAIVFSSIGSLVAFILLLCLLFFR
jgi:tetratricopeptide (TPR) repeat protein